MSTASHRTTSGQSIVVAGALVRDGLLIGAQRATPEALAGYWELPGGKVEPDENPADALHRELIEELGTRVVVGDVVHGPVDGDWPLGDHSVLRVFLVTSFEPEPVAGDSHLQVRWLASDEAAALTWLPADLAPVQAVFAVSEATS